MVRINGWHRLFISGSIIYFIIIVSGFMLTYPSKTDIYKRWLSSLVSISWTNHIREQVNDKINHNQSLSFLEKIKLVERYYIETLTPKPATHENPFLDLPIQNSDKLKNTINSYRDKYSKELIKLTGEQTLVIKTSLLMYCIPLIIIYLIGFLTKWTKDGFKGQS